MATIAELVGHKKLPIKVRRRGWSDNRYFEVLAVTLNGTYLGQNDMGGPVTESLGASWELYTEPKKTRKVKLEAWWVYIQSDSLWYQAFYEGGGKPLGFGSRRYRGDPKEDREIEIAEEESKS